MRFVIGSLLAFSLLLAAPGESRAAQCTGEGVAETLAAARAQCCPARTRGRYISCAAHLAKRAIRSGELEASCKREILKAGCGGVSTTSTTQPPTTTTTTTVVPPTTSTTRATTTTTTTTLAPPTTSTTRVTTTTTTTTLVPPTTSTTRVTTTTTTTTLAPTTTTTTSTSSTTTTTLAACCGFDPTRLSFTTTVGTGNCGTVQNSSGTTLLTLACSGLYTGCNNDTVPLPIAVPDQGNNLTKITACTAGTGAITLAHLTSAETGSIYNCTAAGCRFGAPLPIPNAGNPAVSTCVINTVASNASGSGNCLTGASSVSIPLTSQVYLTGDLLAGTPGIQPCPLCISGTCQGGPNNGGGCTAQTSTFKTCADGANTGKVCTVDGDCPTSFCNQTYPTSHDCPPSTLVGTIPIAFALTTGSMSKTAVDQPAQQRVFCGFCWDDDASNGAAGGPGTCTLDANYTCLNNLSCSSVGKGTCQGAVSCTSDAGCAAVSASRESCRQSDRGAFKQLNAKTITVTGTPAGNMTDGAPHASNLVSVFCIPPTFDGTVDGAGGLPGPGATTLVGTAQLLP